MNAINLPKADKAGSFRGLRVYKFHKSVIIIEVNAMEQSFHSAMLNDQTSIAIFKGLINPLIFPHQSFYTFTHQAQWAHKPG